MPKRNVYAATRIQIGALRIVGVIQAVVAGLLAGLFGGDWLAGLRPGVPVLVPTIAVGLAAERLAMLRRIALGVARIAERLPEPAGASPNRADPLDVDALESLSERHRL